MFLNKVWRLMGNGAIAIFAVPIGSGILLCGRKEKEGALVTITFCGHGQLDPPGVLAEKIVSIIQGFVKNDCVEFLLGGMGRFDGFAFRCCTAYKSKHPDAKILFVTPYPDDGYLKRRQDCHRYDGVVVPPIEDIPPKWRISKRNQYMVQQSDLLIAYVNHGWGGAAQTLLYAYRKHKHYVNLGTYSIE